jgi:hypothetical protein
VSVSEDTAIAPMPSPDSLALSTAELAFRQETAAGEADDR